MTYSVTYQVGAKFYTSSENLTHLRVISIPHAFKLVKDTVILVQRAELATQVLMDRESLHRLGVHQDVPDLD